MPYPVLAQFSRQQMASLTGLPDDVLGYWMREGLLVSLQPETGKGYHRRFDFRQVHLAALLGELWGFGVKVASLKSFAELVNRGIAFADDYYLKYDEIAVVIRIAYRLQAFRSRMLTWDSDPLIGRVDQLPSDELELIEQVLRDKNPENVRRKFVLHAAEGLLQRHESRALAIYSDLVREDHLEKRGISGQEHLDERSLYIWLDSEAKWHIVPPSLIGTLGPKIKSPRSAIVLSVSLIFRQIWSPETDTEVADKHDD
ncbi:MAG: MerR family transcriptional regulator [Janthinobacterium lividum]